MMTVTAGILEMNGRMLIARRKSGGALAGKWEFPGGKLEAGETPEQCLARELQEEFGVLTRVEGLFTASTYPYDHGTIKLLAYRVTHISGEFALHDHDEIEWVSAEELSAFDFAPADVPIVQRLMMST